MARRRRRSRARSYARSYRRRSYGGKGGVQKAAIDGLMAGAAPGLVRRFLGNPLGNLTEAASIGVVGVYRKNPTLVMLAALTAAQQFVGGSNGNNGNGGSGAFE